MEKIHARVFVGLAQDASRPGFCREIDNLLSNSHQKINLHWEQDIELADLHILDWEFLEGNNTLSMPGRHSHRTILLSSRSKEFNVRNILLPYSINHLIGQNSQFLHEEVAECLTRILTSDFGAKIGNLFHSTPLYQRTGVSSQKADQIIQEMLASLQSTAFFESFKDHLKLVANELMSNAFGPIEGESSTIQCSWTLYPFKKDQHCFVLSVCDSRGNLTREKVMEALNRSFTTKKAVDNPEGGAGLGLYLVYSLSNMLIFNISKGRQSEIICLFEEGKRFKKFQERITSFHFYQEERG